MNEELIKLISREAIFIKDPEIELNYHKYRELTFHRLECITRNIRMNPIDLFKDPNFIIRMMNVLHVYDLSLAVKFGVNFGLFGVGLARLGSLEQILPYLEKLTRGEIFGCLAVTEIGHGSNLKGLETTATWMEEDKHFILHSPTYSSTKCWIGNAACHGTHAIVYAQLRYNHELIGLHAFIVQLRDSEWKVMPNITITDNGPKKGLNGVDNGMIKFSQVIVGRENLLNNYGYIDENGIYIRSHDNAGQRFGELLSTFTAGRCVIASGANFVSKKALTIGCKYAQQRVQFAGKNGIEKPIIQYTSHQVRLMPLVAKIIALNYAVKVMKDLCLDDYLKTNKISKKGHILSSILKVVSGEHAEKVCGEVRRCCGGHGYAYENYLGSMQADIDIYTTFEGDNTLLRQEACKCNLSILKDQIGSGPALQFLYFYKMKLYKYLFGYIPIIMATEDKILKLLTLKEKHTTLQLIENIITYTNSKVELFEAWNLCLTTVLSCTDSYADKKIYKVFLQKQSKDEKDWLLLYGCSLIEANIHWYLMNGLMSTSEADDIIKLKEILCRKVVGSDLDNVLNDKFAIPKMFWDVPILKISSRL